MNALVNYSDSESESDSPRPTTAEIAPSSSGVDVNVDALERPYKRHRSFPHVRGNWPTHVYIPVEVDEDLKDDVQELLADLRSMLPTNTSIDLLLEGSFLHLSVSRTVVLRLHQIEPFVKMLKTRLESMSSITMDIGGLRHFVNENKTRSFLGLKCARGLADILRVVDHVDHVMRCFELPHYYEERCMHISLLSWNHNAAPICSESTLLPSLVAQTQTRLYEAIHAPAAAASRDSMSINFDALQTKYKVFAAQTGLDDEFVLDTVCCKIGDKKYFMPLKG